MIIIRRAPFPKTGYWVRIGRGRYVWIGWHSRETPRASVISYIEKEWNLSLTA